METKRRVEILLFVLRKDRCREKHLHLRGRARTYRARGASADAVVVIGTERITRGNAN